PAEVRDVPCGLDRNENSAKGLRIGTAIRGVAYVDGEPRASGDRRGHRHSADRGFDHVLHVPDGEAISCDGVTIRHDIDVLAARLAFRERAARASYLAEHVFEGDADPLDFTEVAPEDLDADGCADTCRQHVDPRSD